jgi:hypothetical protein
MHGMQGDLIGEHAVDKSCGIPVHCIADGYDGQPSTLAAIVSFEGRSAEQYRITNSDLIIDTRKRQCQCDKVDGLIATSDIDVGRI